MLDSYGYERLMPEYTALYRNRKCGRAINMTAYLPLFAIGIALTVLFALPSMVDFGAGIVIMPVIVIGLVYFYVSKQKAWIKTVKIIKTSAATECAVTDCDLSVKRNYAGNGRQVPNTYIIIKFAYDKDGAEITDMCRLYFTGEYTGDITKAYIRLFVGQGGEKVISVTPPPDSRGFSRHEHRTICR